MLVFTSKIVVLALGVTVFVLAAWGVVVPDKLMTLVKSTMDRPSGIYIAVIVRVVLGAALIGVAPATVFPVVFEVLGIVTLVAAIALAIAGRDRVRRFMEWWIERFSPVVNRLWLLFGMGFGAFLVYGVL